MTESNSGTWRHPPSLCVAGLAPDDIHHCFAWQPWHLATSTFTLRGRRGTRRQPPSFCVAGGALMALGWLCGVLGRCLGAIGRAVTPWQFAW